MELFAAYFSELGTPAVMTLVLLLTSIWLHTVHSDRKAGRILEVFTYAFMTVLFMKHAGDVLRPGPYEGGFFGLFDPAFPSAHALLGTTVYGLAAYVLIRRAKRKSLKYLIGIVASFIIFGIGFSRVYYNYHWPSDVIAGWLIGLLFVGILAWFEQKHRVVI